MNTFVATEIDFTENGYGITEYHAAILGAGASLSAAQQVVAEYDSNFPVTQWAIVGPAIFDALLEGHAPYVHLPNLSFIHVGFTTPLEGPAYVIFEMHVKE